MTGMPETPMLDYLANVFAEVQSLRDAVTTAHREFEKQKALYEQLRPHWAQGYTSDSMAAQGQTAALSQLWEMLGVDNQTAAVVRMRNLLSKEHKT